MKLMKPGQVPARVKRAIQRCWPDGVVEEFDESESYFQEIRDALRADLIGIRGASVLHETPDRAVTHWDDDDNDDEPEPPADYWQSYDVFFVALAGDEFEFETETDAGLESEDEDTGPVQGRGWYGCVVAISLAAPVGAIQFSEYSEFEDGSSSIPDLVSGPYSEDTGETVDPDVEYRKALGDAAFEKLSGLRNSIAAILAKRKVVLLEPAVLIALTPGLTADSDVFVEEPLTVRGAFFFHGA
jgi:hypothetical protein